MCAVLLSEQKGVKLTCVDGIMFLAQVWGKASKYRHRFVVILEIGKVQTTL